MRKFLIFAGTREGRLLAEHLCSLGMDVHISVATGYGEEVLPRLLGLTIHRGRLRGPALEELVGSGDWEAVIDATHPYALEITGNLREACKRTGKPYLRLLREDAADGEQEESWIPPVSEKSGTDGGPGEGDALPVYVNSKEEAAEYLNGKTGAILLTTGSKELKDYVNLISDTSRIFARILPDSEAVKQCRELGLSGRQIICMQGPYSAALNEAMLRQLEARYLVTKETGAAGGFPQKLAGARAAGAVAVVQRRPREEGYGMGELLEYLKLPGIEPGMDLGMETEPGPDLGMEIEPGSDLGTETEPGPGAEWGQMKPEASGDRKPEWGPEKQTVTMAGIGMGDPLDLTRAAARAFREADVIFGAPRMIKALQRFEKPMEPLYQPKAIREYLEQHPECKKAAVAFSGDVGFYSGTKKLLEELEEEKYNIDLICGISSVQYVAARLRIPWQDLKLISLHGRQQNLVGAVRTHEKVFVLAGKAESIRELAGILQEYGLEQVTLLVGSQLSYPEEEFCSGRPGDFLNFQKEGLSVAVVENPEAARTAVTHGLPDAWFQRGNAPMTKEEIRSISISKLALTKDALVYDIGAGTGSIGIECALQAAEGQVFAIEKKQDAVELLLRNQRKFGALNLTAVTGTAPEALAALPAPSHAFIGGSSGNLVEITEVLLRKNPKVRIVINAIAMETVAEVMGLMQKQDFEVAEIVQVFVGKARKLGSYHMMMGQNPVYIFTLQKELP